IKREYSNARTPQQNGVVERKNMTLIEAVRTMLADSFVSTACYVLNSVLVTKPHNKTPYELLTGFRSSQRNTTLEGSDQKAQEGRKFAKGEPSVYRDPLFEKIPEDTHDYMESEYAQDMGRTRDIVGEENEYAEDVLSTEKEKVSTDKEKVSTDRPIVSTDRSKVIVLTGKLKVPMSK
ncbi:putative ribonuclease H-like domain-containing protein, partial [Tanacetum coccineum]